MLIGILYLTFNVCQALGRPSIGSTEAGKPDLRTQGKVPQVHPEGSLASCRIEITWEPEKVKTEFMEECE